MKTAFSHQPSAFRRSVLVFVLCSLFLVPAFAQEAFYIYRNDGDFNGFFYDEVIEMRQSKIGVDSVEYDKWVTQEVVLADTIYRIPLAAIASISFIQPEIKFNPRLLHMDDLGMTPYIIARDSQNLTFSGDLPVSLVPHVGNVLIGFTEILEDGGFGGRVENIRNENGNIIVETSRLTKLSDVFEKFITVEQIGAVEDSASRVRYRMAGLKKMPQATDVLSATLFNINTNVHYPILSEDNATATIDASLQFIGKLTVVYKIEGDVFFVKFGASQEIGFQPSLSMKVSAGGEKTQPLIPIPGIKFPAPAPLFEFNPAPKIGFRYGGEFGMKINFPAIGGKISETFKIDTEDPDLVVFQLTPKSTSPQIGNLIDAIDNTDFEFKMEGSVQVGLKLELALKTNQWFSQIFSASVGVDLWNGPKANGSVNISGKSLLSGDGPYSFADGNIGFSFMSLDAEAYAKVWYWGGKEHKYTWGDGSIDLLPRLDVYALNKFADFKSEHTDSVHILRAYWEMEPRMTFINHQPGIAVYRKNAAGLPQIVQSRYTTIPTVTSTGDAMNQRFDFDCRTKDWKAGQYFAAPSLQVFGQEYPVISMANSFYVPTTLQLDKDTVHFDVSGQNEQTINIETNANTIYAPNFVTIDTINEAMGEYEAKFTWNPNSHLFVKVDGSHGPSFSIGASDIEHGNLNIPVYITQSDNDLSNVRVSFHVGYGRIIDEFTSEGGGALFDGVVQGIRTNGTIELQGQATQLNETVSDATIFMTVSDARPSESYSYDIISATGTIRNKHIYQDFEYGTNWEVINKTVTIITEISFQCRGQESIGNGGVSSFYFDENQTTITAGTSVTTEVLENGQTRTFVRNLQEGDDTYGRGYIQVKVPGEQ